MLNNKLLLAFGSLVLGAACSAAPSEEIGATTQAVQQLGSWLPPSLPGGVVIDSVTAPSLALGGNESIYATRGPSPDFSLARFARYGVNDWTRGEDIGGGCGVPAAVGQTTTHQDVFCNATVGNNLWHQWIDHGYWGEWENLGGGLDPNSPVAASSWAPGRLDVFAIASGHVWHAAWGGADWAWEDFGGPFKLTGLAAVAPAASKLDVFAVDAAGEVKKKKRHRRWGPRFWVEYPGAGLKPPTSARNERPS